MCRDFGSMPAEITLHSNNDRGREIIDELEKQTEMKPTGVMDDCTRRYNLSATDAGIGAFDPMPTRPTPTGTTT